jgi:hypothetical protein
MPLREEARKQLVEEG